MMTSVIIALLILIFIIEVIIIISLKGFHAYYKKREIKYLAIGIIFMSLAISIILGIWYVMNIGFT